MKPVPAPVAQRFLVLLLALLSGCHGNWPRTVGPHDTRRSYHDTVGLTIEYPDVDRCATPAGEAAMAALSPWTFEDPSELPTWDLTLEEAIRMAVGQSPVLRTTGVSIVQMPEFTVSAYEPALADANPFGGVEAALADFDAQLATAMMFQRNERPNNIDIGGLFFQAPVLEQRLAQFNAEVAKTTATGGQFALRHVVIYDRNNQPLRRFPSDFTGWVEAEWRQPLLQGAGTHFNRIAGPNSPIGQYNGVLIARINTDVSLADFERAVIDLVADIEQAYWELYYAYRFLEAQLRGRESALQSFQLQDTRWRAGAETEGEVAQARSQYFQFQAQVENALGGPNGLYALEQRLRYLLGEPTSDGRLIKPISEPQQVRFVFDWQSALDQALQRRVEIRRQMWNIKRRELELVAARLNRRPRLDFVGLYRWRGLGDNLLGPSDAPPFDNLYGEIAGGDFQEWQAGMELTMPVGMRRASAAVSHAQLNVARERAILSETELRISHDLAEAARELSRAHRLLQTNYNRWMADQRQVDVLSQRAGVVESINFLLQSQRQLVTSESDFYRSLVDYNLALREVHRQKGSLLAYNHVNLAEGAWNGQAYRDAYETGRFFTPRPNPAAVHAPRPLSQGGFDPSAPMATGLPPLDAFGAPPAENPEISITPAEQIPPPERFPAGD